MSGPLDFGPPGGDRDDEEERRRRLDRREDPDLRDERLYGTPPRPGARRPHRTWRTPLALLAIFGALVAVMLGTLRSDESTPGPEVGAQLPPFAAPLAASTLEGAVNVRRQEPPDGGRIACEVRGPDVLNICDLARRGPLVLTFFATQGDECVGQLDTVQRVRPRHPDVSFAAVALGDERDRIRDLLRRRGWDFPVGHDEEGLLASVYGVAVCPLIVFVEQGGKVADTNFGVLGAAELSRQVTALEQRG